MSCKRQRPIRLALRNRRSSASRPGLRIVCTFRFEINVINKPLFQIAVFDVSRFQAQQKDIKLCLSVCDGAIAMNLTLALHPCNYCELSKRQLIVRPHPAEAEMQLCIPGRNSSGRVGRQGRRNAMVAEVYSDSLRPHASKSGMGRRRMRNRLALVYRTAVIIRGPGTCGNTPKLSTRGCRWES